MEFGMHTDKKDVVIVKFILFGREGHAPVVVLLLELNQEKNNQKKGSHAYD